MSTELLADARRLADVVSSMGILASRRPRRPRLNHIGALLCDAVLQSGLNYRTVVSPRVLRVVQLFPQAADLPEFSAVLLRYGAHYVLMWKHHEKPRRLLEIVGLLEAESIKTVLELGSWMDNESNRSRLLDVRGVGPKTIDYMAMLAGADGVAIDRHIEAFLSAVGIAHRDYAQARRIVCFSADLLGVRRASLDQAIWETCSLRERKRRP